MGDGEKKGLYLNLKTFITNWVGLFNYNYDRIKIVNKFYKKDDLKDKKCFLFRTKDKDIKEYENQGDKSLEDDSIFQVKIRNDHFILYNIIAKKLYLPNTININSIKNKIWYIVNNEKDEKKNDNEKGKEEKQTENEDYYISQGDIIKLGKDIFIFTEIFLQNNNIIIEKENNIIYDINSLNKDKGLIFNICSQPYILNEKNYCEHIVNDLKEGKKSKEYEKIKNLIKKNIMEDSYISNNVRKYKISLYKCEKCKNRFYPLRFKLSENSEVIEFIEIEKPKDKNYIILESLEELEDIDKEVIKYFYVIELTGEDETIKIGRNKDNNVILEDKTFSRYHSVIKYIKNKGKLLLNNKTDSTNTTVLIKNDIIEISEKRGIYLQSGTTSIEARIIKKEENETIEKNYELEKKKSENNDICQQDLLAEKRCEEIYGDES